MRFAALVLLAATALSAQDQPASTPNSEAEARAKAEANAKAEGEVKAKPQAVRQVPTADAIRALLTGAVRNCSIPLLHVWPVGKGPSSKTGAATDEKMIIPVPKQPIDRMPLLRAPAPSCDDIDR